MGPLAPFHRSGDHKGEPITKPFFSCDVPLPPNVSYQLMRRDRTRSHVSSTPAFEQFKTEAAARLSVATRDPDLLHAIRSSRYRVPLGVRIHVFFPFAQGRRNMRNLDSVNKSVLDAVFRSLDLDEELIDELHVTAHRNANEPHVFVEVRCLLQDGK